MLTYHWWGSMAFISGHYPKMMWRYQSIKQDSKIAVLKWHPGLPGSNELKGPIVSLWVLTEIVGFACIYAWKEKWGFIFTIYATLGHNELKQPLLWNCCGTRYHHDCMKYDSNKVTWKDQILISLDMWDISPLFDIFDYPTFVGKLRDVCC